MTAEIQIRNPATTENSRSHPCEAGGLSIHIKQFAREAGFELCGIAPVRNFGELEIFPSWIADQRHGEMKYMEARNEAGDLKRANLTNAAPWARSVIVCAINYNTAQPYSTQVDPAQSQGSGWISRYAWGHEDYHDAVMRRIQAVEMRLREFLDATDDATNNSADGAADDQRPPTDDSLQTRAYVDTGPLIERVYAKYAGIGWIGKNTCVINQKLGSWLFLGVILASLEISPKLAADLPAPDRCGTCTRCIAACPTQAIVAPGELDARLCISYLTIEKRGKIPEDLREGMGRHVFGCDICQDVCPWNRKAPVTTADEFRPRADLVNPELKWLAEMQPEEFRATFRGSPVRRAKLSGLRRNAVIAMGNSDDQKFLPTLKKLAEDADPIVAEHAKWALARHLKGEQESRTTNRN
ncbi:MAG: tRNA epoxyqueuosine(34) reductase QueG [Terriglobales bacterium]